MEREHGLSGFNVRGDQYGTYIYKSAQLGIGSCCPGYPDNQGTAESRS